MTKKKKWFIAIAVIAVLVVLAGRSAEEKLTPGVGLLEIVGPITESYELLQTIREFEKDEMVKSVLVRIDSPGGSVGPSQEIYEALLRLRETKPVVASMSAVGASGGYYIALAAEQIYAMPGTMTGSIGVIMQFMDMSSGLDKLGIKGQAVTSGAMKDAGSTFREMTPKERLYFKSLVDDVHAQFVEAVVESRKLPVEQVEPVADGRVLTGRQAFEAGLIDALGGFDLAFKDARERAGLEADARLIKPRKKANLMDDLREYVGATLPVQQVRLEYSIW